jgi:hypothetical protein
MRLRPAPPARVDSRNTCPAPRRLKLSTCGGWRGQGRTGVSGARLGAGAGAHGAAAAPSPRRRAHHRLAVVHAGGAVDAHDRVAARAAQQAVQQVQRGGAGGHHHHALPAAQDALLRGRGRGGRWRDGAVPRGSPAGQQGGAAAAGGSPARCGSVPGLGARGHRSQGAPAQLLLRRRRRRCGGSGDGGSGSPAAPPAPAACPSSPAARARRQARPQATPCRRRHPPTRSQPPPRPSRPPRRRLGGRGGCRACGWLQGKGRGEGQGC